MTTNDLQAKTEKFPRLAKLWRTRNESRFDLYLTHFTNTELAIMIPILVFEYFWLFRRLVNVHLGIITHYLAMYLGVFAFYIGAYCAAVSFFGMLIAAVCLQGRRAGFRAVAFGLNVAVLSALAFMF